MVDPSKERSQIALVILRGAFSDLLYITLRQPCCMKQFLDVVYVLGDMGDGVVGNVTFSL